MQAPDWVVTCRFYQFGRFHPWGQCPRRQAHHCYKCLKRGFQGYKCDCGAADEIKKYVEEHGLQDWIGATAWLACCAAASS
jgi:hypothetical protein